MHDLYLDILPTVNLATFRVNDVSSYSENAPYENGVVEITPPTYNAPTLALRVNKGWSVVFNSSNLRIAPATGGVKSALPDGNYYIKFSVAPNQSVYVAYNYFRNNKQLASYGELITLLNTNKPNISTRDYAEFRKNILTLKQEIDAAKYLAENKFMQDEALLVYAENDKQIELIKNKISWWTK